MSTKHTSPDERGWTLTRTTGDVPVIAGMRKEEALEIWASSFEGFKAADPEEADTSRTAFVLEGVVEGAPSAWTAGGEISWPVDFPATKDGVYAERWLDRADGYTLFLLVEEGVVTAGLSAYETGGHRGIGTIWSKPGGARGYRLLVAALEDQGTPLNPDSTMSEGACRIWKRAALEAAGGTAPVLGDKAAFDLALVPRQVRPVPPFGLDELSREGLAELNYLAFGERFQWALDDEQGRFLTNDSTDSAELRAEFGWPPVPNRS